MRILHVDPALEWRGGQRQLLLLVEGLRERGIQQQVACAEAGLLRSALPEDVPQVHLPPGWSLSGMLRLRAAARGQDLVAAHSSHAHQLCLGLPQPWLVHRRVDFPLRGAISRWKYRQAGMHICVSEAVKQVLTRGGVSERRCVVVHDGVEPPPPASPASLGPGPVVLAVGALVDHKDHATLAEAARDLDARVLVAGEGPLREALSESRLELLGHRPDVPALLARADVFVHSSKEEGMGQAVAEAMMAGVPVVATRAGGVPEVVGDCGLLVPARDPSALREALRRALRGEHPSTEAARERAMQRFSTTVMVEQTLEAYRRLIASADRLG